jgi:Flp pilus assembly protein TadG
MFRRADDGSASIELAILTPSVLAVLALLFIAGRTMVAKQSIDAVAFDAARTASLARDAGTAQTMATSAATASLAAQALNCGRLTVNVDTSGFAIAVGEPANVTVTIVCDVNFADVAFPGMPGGTTLTSTFTSPLDRYRSRS